jgi:hypothetical protein
VFDKRCWRLQVSIWGSQTPGKLNSFFRDDFHRNSDSLLNNLLQLMMSALLIASRYGFLPHIDACQTKKYPSLGRSIGDLARDQTRMTVAGVNGRSANPQGKAALSQNRSISLTVD